MQKANVGAKIQTIFEMTKEIATFLLGIGKTCSINLPQMKRRSRMLIMLSQSQRGVLEVSRRQIF
jgi:hypothetical protein